MEVADKKARLGAREPFHNFHVDFNWIAYHKIIKKTRRPKKLTNYIEWDNLLKRIGKPEEKQS